MPGVQRHACPEETTSVALTIKSGPWDEETTAAFLVKTIIPIRLASLRTDAGGRTWPVLQSLWFSYRQGSLWCATQAGSPLTRRLARDTAVAFEVSCDDPPYHGVRGTGEAEIIPEAEDVLLELIERYGQRDTPLAAWLLGRVATEVAIRISSLQVSTWDYASRMRPAPHRDRRS